MGVLRPFHRRHLCLPGRRTAHGHGIHRQPGSPSATGPHPDLTLLFDAPVGVGMARAKHRGPADRLETETLAFFERVRGAYLQLADDFPQRIKIIDAAQSLAEVQAAIAVHLQQFCGS